MYVNKYVLQPEYYRARLGKILQNVELNDKMYSYVQWICHFLQIC